MSNNTNVLNKIYNFILYAYIVVIFGAMPLALKSVKYAYNELGQFKYKFFLISTLVFLGCSILLLIISGIARLQGRNRKASGRNRKASGRHRLNFIYAAIIAYAVSSVITFALSIDKATAFYGADGWNMGFLSTILFLGIFIVIGCGPVISVDIHTSASDNHDNTSYINPATNNILHASTYRHYALLTVIYTIAALTAAVFILGILHRFYFDPLGLYTSVPTLEFRGFLSTIGQPTWYSGFLCMMYPVGIAFFYLDKNNTRRWLSGTYCVISFCTLVTQSSDSAFLSLAGVMLLLFFISFKDRHRMLRFLEIMIVLCTTFMLTGLFIRLFEGHVYSMSPLSVYASQGKMTRFALILCVLLRIIFANKKMIPVWNTSLAKIIRNIFFTVIGILSVLLIIFIIINSRSPIEKPADTAFSDGYLYFDKGWGNHRGAIWELAAKMYRSLPLSQKLFGIGQDCFGAYNFDANGCREYLQNIYGNSTLACAHNELLNMLICNGAIGTASFLSLIIAIIVTGIKSFHAIDKSTEDYSKNKTLIPDSSTVADTKSTALLKKEEPDSIGKAILLGSVMCIISYMCHNLFCYSNVVTTPHLWIYFPIVAKGIHSPNNIE